MRATRSKISIEALEEPKSGRIRLTGLFLLSTHLESANARALLAEARGKSRRQIEELLARIHPPPDVPERIEELPGSFLV
jgi:hypothetical protein